MAALIPVAVDLGEVSGVIGTGDKRLVQRVIRKYAKELRRVDRRVADLEREGEPDEGDEWRVSPKALLRGLRVAKDSPRPREKCKRDLAMLVRTRGLARLCADLDRAQAELERSEGLSRRDKKAIDGAFTALLAEVVRGDSDAEPESGPRGQRASTEDVCGT